ncbi:hypothetical protein SHIRM173S_04944 [Streptomyces hirsutus]
MITSVRRAAAVCALITALAACAACAAPRPGQRPRPSPSATPATPAPRLPTLAPGPAGLTPVFENAPRSAGKTLALTFDADMTADQGPRAAAGERFDHPRLIATLRALKVPSTVFMTGRWAEEYPDQARSIGRDPLFEVANHSYSHYAFTDDCYGLPTVGRDRIRADVERAYTAFREVGVAHPMPYFRFPGGCYDREALKALVPAGVTAVQWTWSAATPSPRTPTRWPGRSWTECARVPSSSCTAPAARPRRPSARYGRSSRTCAVARPREQIAHGGHRHDRDRRARQTLQQPGTGEQIRVVGGEAQQRGDDVAGEPHQHRAAAAEDVGQRPGDQLTQGQSHQHTGEGELDLRRRRVQVASHLGHGREVHVHREGRHRHQERDDHHHTGRARLREGRRDRRRARAGRSPR